MGSFTQTLKMFSSQIVCLVLLPLCLSSEEQPSLVTSFPPSMIYHSSECTPEKKSITTQDCKPRSQEDCEEVSVPSQKLEYTLSCYNLTVTHCTEDLTSVSLDSQREKEGPEAPLVPLVGTTCLETQQEHCIQTPVVTDVTTMVLRCLIRTLVECVDVEYDLPKVVCHKQELNYISGPSSSEGTKVIF